MPVSQKKNREREITARPVFIESVNIRSAKFVEKEELNVSGKVRCRQIACLRVAFCEWTTCIAQFVILTVALGA